MRKQLSTWRKCQFLIGVAALLLFGCSRNPPVDGAHSAVPDSIRGVSNYTFEIVKVYPHDPNAFTQGLVFQDGIFLESTGLRAQSSLRKVELETGRVLQRVDVPIQYFAEGLAVLNGKAYQLTWQEQTMFVYNANTLFLESQFSYQGEGWGLTTDGTQLIMSDGTDELRFIDPRDFQEKRRIKVRLNGTAVDKLNELEYVKGEIFANVWKTDWVARIAPETGAVTGIIDFRGILPEKDRDTQTDVFNGIAYDAATDRLFVTGKRWPKVFEVRLRPK